MKCGEEEKETRRGEMRIDEQREGEEETSESESRGNIQRRK